MPTAETYRKNLEHNLKVTQLPPLNGRPLPPYGEDFETPLPLDFSKGRNVRDWSTLKNDHEGQVEFWRAGIHVEAEFIRAENALGLIVAVRAAVAELIGNSDDLDGVEKVVSEAVRDLVVPGAEDAVVRYLKWQRDHPDAREPERMQFDALIQDYRMRVATGDMPWAEDA